MLLGIVGGMGEGKTVLMVSLLDFLFTNNTQVVSNLDLTNFINPKNLDMKPRKLSLIDLIQFTEKPELWRNIGLGWDEIYVNLECRISATSELNRIASYFLFQSRKRDVHIIWTSQLFGTPDNRLRWATLEVGQLIKCKGIRVYCEKKGKFVNATPCWRYKCPNLPTCIREKNFTLKFKRWNGSRWATYRKPHIEKWFNKFDTTQIIDYEETVLASAYLSARSRAYKKHIKNKIEEILGKRTATGFMQELEDELLKV